MFNHCHTSAHLESRFETINALGPSINDVGSWEGTKIGQHCQQIVLKKLPTWGRRVSKIRKNCRRHLWMVPKYLISFAGCGTNSIGPESTQRKKPLGFAECNGSKAHRFKSLPRISA